jgi:hypothetical protein
MTGPNWSKVISVMPWLILLLKSSMALAAFSTAFVIIDEVKGLETATFRLFHQDSPRLHH